MYPNRLLRTSLCIRQAGIFTRTVSIEADGYERLEGRYRQPTLILSTSAGLIRTNGWSVLAIGKRSLKGHGDPRSPMSLHDKNGLVYAMDWRRDGTVVVTGASGCEILRFEQEVEVLSFRPWVGRLTVFDQAVDFEEAASLAAYLWTFFENDRRTST